MNYTKGDKLIYIITEKRGGGNSNRYILDRKKFPCTFLEYVGKASCKVEMESGIERVKTVLLKQLEKLDEHNENRSG